MQVHHRNFGEYMWLDERPVRNDHSKIKWLNSVQFKEVINFVRHRQPEFDRRGLHWTWMKIVTAGSSFINSGHHVTNINVGFNKRTQHRYSEFGRT